MTTGIKNEIKYCDVQKISEYMEKQGIKNDFKGNKIVAWSSLKCVQLIQTLNKLYNLQLSFPKGIYVEDFENLKGIDMNACGFVNYAPINLYKEKSLIMPEQTIFFNEFKDKQIWSNLDYLSDKDYDNGLQATDFFLEKFIHEFMHVIHEQNLILKLGGQKLVKSLQQANSPKNLQAYQKKYTALFKQICEYATFSPLETVACDMSKRVIKSIDKNNLTPNLNFLSASPYKNQSMLFNFYSKKFERILHKIWNGNLIFD